eukprot:2244440-Pyramimonas_sp.AAC.1
MAPSAVRGEVTSALRRAARLHTKAALRARRRSAAFWAQVGLHAAVKPLLSRSLPRERENSPRERENSPRERENSILPRIIRGHRLRTHLLLVAFVAAKFANP